MHFNHKKGDKRAKRDEYLRKVYENNALGEDAAVRRVI